MTTALYVTDSTGDKYNYYEFEGTLKSNPFIWDTLHNHFDNLEQPITINIL